MKKAVRNFVMVLLASLVSCSFLLNPLFVPAFRVNSVFLRLMLSNEGTKWPALKWVFFLLFRHFCPINIFIVDNRERYQYKTPREK